jgi:serine/threonine protein kinase
MPEQLKVGQYILERKLGEGGMAEVWAARHVHLGSNAAIKFLRAGFAGDPELEERFLNEGKRQARVQHQNIVPALDFVQADGRSYLVMQYVEGENLETRLQQRNGPLKPKEVHSIASDVLSALDYAHSLGVIHRDVKPSNILLEKHGRALLSDFGIALALGDERRATRTGTAIGTPEYMSPEQITQPRAVDARSDIYSFGCVLYAMLTGGPPFGIGGTTEFYVQDCHVHTAPQSPARRNPAISPALARVVLQCLEKDPAKRFQSCGSVMKALDGITDLEDPTGTGRQVGQYVLEEKLGQGGMAEVWSARHQVLGTRVAVKFLSTRLAGNPEIEHRFLGEGKRQAQLQHPNIVSAHDFLYINERSYLIMKYIEGQTLDEWLSKLKAPLSVPEAITVSTDVLRALDYAHSQKVIHRDIKPSNILMANTGRAFVMDFGIALVLGEQRATKAGMAIGTPHFMSPEQIVGAANIDRQTDIYSFGCVLYQMLTRKLPFEAKSADGDSDYSIQEKHLRQKPETPRKFNPDLPEHIERAILRCLEKNATDRFDSCAELLAALNQASPRHIPTSIELPAPRPAAQPPVPSQPVPARTVLLSTPSVASATPIAVNAAPSSPLAPVPPSERRAVPWMLIVVLFTLVLLGGGFYLVVRQRQNVKSAPPATPQPLPAQTAPISANPQPPSPSQIVSVSSNPQPSPAVASPKADQQPQPEVSSPAPQPPPVVKRKPVQIPAQPPASESQDKAVTERPVLVPAAEIAELSGSWQGEYNHPASKEIKKITLRISEDQMELLTGTLNFDPEGVNASSCSLSGNYNPRTKFLLLIVGACHGRPPEYLKGSIGFASVNSSDRQATGMDQVHDSLVRISR